MIDPRRDARPASQGGRQLGWSDGAGEDTDQVRTSTGPSSRTWTGGSIVIRTGCMTNEASRTARQKERTLPGPVFGRVDLFGNIPTTRPTTTDDRHPQKQPGKRTPGPTKPDA